MECKIEHQYSLLLSQFISYFYFNNATILISHRLSLVQRFLIVFPWICDTQIWTLRFSQGLSMYHRQIKSTVQSLQTVHLRNRLRIISCICKNNTANHLKLSQLLFGLILRTYMRIMKMGPGTFLETNISLTYM